MLTRKQLLAGAITGAGGYLASGALGGGKGHGWGTTHKLGRTTTTTTTGPHDTTSFIDDLGIFTAGSTLGNQTNRDKYATIITGTDYSYTSLPGQTLKYTAAPEAYSGDGIARDVVTARANTWLLHDHTGAEVPNGTNRYLDITNASFQTDWLAQARAFLQAHTDIEGLFLDDWTSAFDRPAGYPYYTQGWNGTSGGTLLLSNDTDWQNAAINFFQNCLAPLKSDGYLLVPNARGSLTGVADSDGSLSITWMDQYHTYVTGTMIEFWQQDAGSGWQVFLEGPITQFWHNWDGWMDCMRHANSLGLGFYPLCYDDPTRTTASREQQQKYFRASFLMEWNGGGSAGHYSTLLTGNFVNSADIWLPNAHGLDPGQPLSAKQTIGTGFNRCYKRQFEHYLIYVNPSQSTQTLDGHSVASGDTLWIAS